MSAIYHRGIQKAVGCKPSNIELGWIAGFIEGEGSFRHNGSSEQVRVTQKDKEPLLKIQRLRLRLFGFR